MSLNIESGEASQNPEGPSRNIQDLQDLQEGGLYNLKGVEVDRIIKTWINYLKDDIVKTAIKEGDDQEGPRYSLGNLGSRRKKNAPRPRPVLNLALNRASDRWRGMIFSTMRAETWENLAQKTGLPDAVLRGLFAPIAGSKVLEGNAEFYVKVNEFSDNRTDEDHSSDFAPTDDKEDILLLLLPVQLEVPPNRIRRHLAKKYKSQFFVDSTSKVKILEHSLTVMKTLQHWLENSNLLENRDATEIEHKSMDDRMMTTANQEDNKKKLKDNEFIKFDQDIPKAREHKKRKGRGDPDSDSEDGTKIHGEGKNNRKEKRRHPDNVELEATGV